MKAGQENDLFKFSPAKINAKAATITAKSCNRLIGTMLNKCRGGRNAELMPRTFVTCKQQTPASKNTLHGLKRS